MSEVCGVEPLGAQRAHSVRNVFPPPPQWSPNVGVRRPTQTSLLHSSENEMPRTDVLQGLERAHY